MPKVKRDVLGYIEATIQYERGNSKEAPPGGYARGLDKAEADLVYLTVRKTLAALGLRVKPEWSPPNDYRRSASTTHTLGVASTRCRSTSDARLSRQTGGRGWRPRPFHRPRWRS